MGHDQAHGKAHDHAHGNGHAHGHGHGHGKAPFHNPVICHTLLDVHHTDVSNFKVNDWKVYQVENTKELMQVKNDLAAKGLKDPWLRNQVWRFDPQYGYTDQRKLFRRTFFAGWQYGLGLFVLVAGAEMAYKKLFGSKDHQHGHHH